MKSAYVLLVLLLIPMACAATLNRTVVDQIPSGQQFAVTYNAEGSESWYLTFKDEVSGGCSPSVYEESMYGENSKQIFKIYTAPNLNTTCTFRGSYMFASTPQTFLPTVTIQIGEKQTPQTNYTINCIEYEERCSGNQVEKCLNKTWINNGTVIGRCGFSENGANINSDCAFTIKGYCIKSWHILVAIGLLAFFMLSGKK